MATRPRSVVPAIAPPATNYPTIKDKTLIAMAEEYAVGAVEKNRLEKRLKVLKPALLAAMGDAPAAIAGKRVLNRGTVAAQADKPAVLITKAMVGTEIPAEKGRSGFDTLEVR